MGTLTTRTALDDAVRVAVHNVQRKQEMVTEHDENLCVGERQLLQRSVLCRYYWLLLFARFFAAVAGHVHRRSRRQEAVVCVVTVRRS